MRPHLVNISLAGCFFFFIMIGFPRANLQKSEHVHTVDIVKPPTSIEECVIGGIDIVVQRQFFGFISAVTSAAFVGKSLRTSVVCV